MKNNKSVKILLWEKTVGHIALLENGTIQFEYEEEFKKENLEISPIELPLATTTIFTQQSRATTFNGLPGVIADCLPDRFGMRVIRDFYNKKYGLEDHEIDTIKKILYVGERAIGALDFFPSVVEESDRSIDQFLEIQTLRREAQKTLEGKADMVTANIMRVSGSAGGLQAKALIDYNPQTKEIKSGFLGVSKGFIPCMLKFDGVRDGEEEGYYRRLEYVYFEMARRCGLTVPKTYLLEEEERAHIIIERFDRNVQKEKDFHYASLCGLLTRDYMQKHSCTYEEYFQLTSFLTKDVSEVMEAFKLAVFNIIFRNQDDHTKNFGFLMNKKGEWITSPAFDLNYVRDFGKAKTHQMKFNDKDDEFEYDDFLVVATKFGIKKNQVTKILEKTIEVAGEFLELATGVGLPKDFSKGVEMNFRLGVLK